MIIFYVYHIFYITLVLSRAEANTYTLNVRTFHLENISIYILALENTEQYFPPVTYSRLDV